MMEKLNYLNGQCSTSNQRSSNQLSNNDKCSSKGDKNKQINRRKDASINRFERKQNYQQQTQYNTTVVYNNNQPSFRGANLTDKRPRNRQTNCETYGPNGVRWRDKMNLNETFDDCYQLSDGQKLDSKKRNVNHLLNFRFTPRDQQENFGQRSTCAHKSKHIYPKFNKEQFLQANCQFIVKEGNDYSLHLADPDLVVNWDFIEEIRVGNFKSQITTCPICLNAPIAAKITKCGHIYCWSCILHYFALSDSAFRKCPICYNSISSKDLRSVSFLERSEFKSNDEIELTLMKRKRGSTLFYPVDLTNSILNDNINKKLIVMNSAQVNSNIIEREFSQLSYQMAIEAKTPEACFIESALNSLSERKKAIESSCTEKGDKDVSEDVSKETLAAKPKVEQEGKDDNDCFYFYQSSDGQHIYLHSLNVRMLCTEYITFDKCPTKIKGKIVSMDFSSITEEKRKRYKYLQHLPLTCEFSTVELELTAPLVSEKTLELFKHEIKKRQEERKKKEKEERKHDKRINERNKNSSRVARSIYNQKYSNEGREVSDLIPSSSRTTSESEASFIDETVLETINDNKSTSFASMLKKENKMKFSVQQNEKKTVDNKNSIEQNVVYVVGGEDDEAIAKPLHQYSLSDAFEAALNLKVIKVKKNRKKK